MTWCVPVCAHTSVCLSSFLFIAYDMVRACVRAYKCAYDLFYLFALTRCVPACAHTSVCMSSFFRPCQLACALPTYMLLRASFLYCILHLKTEDGVCVCGGGLMALQAVKKRC